MKNSWLSTLCLYSLFIVIAYGEEPALEIIPHEPKDIYKMDHWLEGQEKPAHLAHLKLQKVGVVNNVHFAGGQKLKVTLWIPTGHPVTKQKPCDISGCSADDCDRLRPEFTDKCGQDTTTPCDVESCSNDDCDKLTKKADELECAPANPPQGGDDTALEPETPVEPPVEQPADNDCHCETECHTDACSDCEQVKAKYEDLCGAVDTNTENADGCETKDVYAIITATGHSESNDADSVASGAQTPVVEEGVGNGKGAGEGSEEEAASEEGEGAAAGAGGEQESAANPVALGEDDKRHIKDFLDSDYMELLKIEESGLGGKKEEEYSYRYKMNKAWNLLEIKKTDLDNDITQTSIESFIEHRNAFLKTYGSFLQGDILPQLMAPNCRPAKPIINILIKFASEPPVTKVSPDSQFWINNVVEDQYKLFLKLFPETPQEEFETTMQIAEKSLKDAYTACLASMVPESILKFRTSLGKFAGAYKEVLDNELKTEVKECTGVHPTIEAFIAVLTEVAERY